MNKPFSITANTTTKRIIVATSLSIRSCTEVREARPAWSRFIMRQE